MGAIRVRRVYDPPGDAEGAQFLVDRLWPRGVRREALGAAEWMQDAAPSHALRKWSAHDPEKWEEFRRRYARELDTNPGAWRPIMEAARRGPVTLLYAARDRERNNAVALAAYLRRQS